MIFGPSIYYDDDLSYLLEDAGDDDAGDDAGGNDDPGDFDMPDDGGDEGAPDEAGDDAGDDDGGGEDAGGDDIGDEEGGEEEEGEGEGDDSDTSDDDSGLEDGEGADEIKNLEKELFSNLSAKQISIKVGEIRKRYTTMYDYVVEIIDRIDEIPKTSESMKPVEQVAQQFDKLKQILSDYITKTFDTLSMVENEINYQRFSSVLKAIDSNLAEIDFTFKELKEKKAEKQKSLNDEKIKEN